MGGVGKALDPTGNKFLGIPSNPISRVVGDVATGGLAEFGRKDPFYGLATNQSSGLPGLFGGSQNQNPIPGPFSLDPNQVAADQAAITGLGTTQSQAQNQLAQQQYDEALKKIPGQVAGALQQEIPQIAESANAAHVFDSSAYPQEIARQQAYLTQNLELPAFQRLQQAQTGALGTQQGFQTGATQRGLSLEDFINQANVAKTIGAQMAPQAPSGKANAGSFLTGAGALGRGLPGFASVLGKGAVSKSEE